MVHLTCFISLGKSSEEFKSSFSVLSVIANYHPYTVNVVLLAYYVTDRFGGNIVVILPYISIFFKNKDKHNTLSNLSLQPSIFLGLKCPAFLFASLDQITTEKVVSVCFSTTSNNNLDI